MSLIALSVVKDALDADAFTADDKRISSLIDAAEALVSQYIRADLVEAFPEGLPPDVVRAIIEVVRPLYDDEIAADEHARLPPMARMFLSAHRRYS